MSTPDVDRVQLIADARLAAATCRASVVANEIRDTMEAAFARWVESDQ